MQRSGAKEGGEKKRKIRLTRICFPVEVKVEQNPPDSHFLLFLCCELVI